VACDTVLSLLAVALFVVEVACTSPVVVGFLRLRCLLKLPQAYHILLANCLKKVATLNYIY
jgi:hypothetical protein